MGDFADCKASRGLTSFLKTAIDRKLNKESKTVFKIALSSIFMEIWTLKAKNLFFGEVDPITIRGPDKIERPKRGLFALQPMRDMWGITPKCILSSLVLLYWVGRPLKQIFEHFLAIGLRFFAN